ncbi:MAG: hypothetical protein KBD24_02795 [Candidatus Pacebacteria bacterium]|nr:hypothetical protein [Candidatus Paceibacterota bacterium]
MSIRIRKMEMPLWCKSLTRAKQFARSTAHAKSPEGLLALRGIVDAVGTEIREFLVDNWPTRQSSAGG